MINYIALGEKQYPVSFSNAAFMRYEDLTGRSGFSDFMEALAYNPETGNVDYVKIKIGFFAKMAFCALIAGGNIAQIPFTKNIDEVAELVNMQNLPDIINAISDALPRISGTIQQGEAKGTTPQKTVRKGGKA